MKRFTETSKWDDPWFRKLSPAAKLLWDWMTGKCDPAGVIDADFDLAAFQTGAGITSATVEEFGHRVRRLPSGKFHIVRFIEFQYGQLSETCPAHKPVFRALESNGIQYPSNRVSNTLQDMDKEKDTDKDGYGGVGGKGVAPCTLAQAKAAAESAGVTHEEAEHWYSSRASDDWMKGGDGNRRPVGREWQHDMKAFTMAVRKNGGTARKPNAPPAKPRPAYTDELPQL